MAYLQVKQLGEIRVVEPAIKIASCIAKGMSHLMLHRYRGIDEEPSYGFVLNLQDVITLEVSEDEILDEEYDIQFKYQKE